MPFDTCCTKLIYLLVHLTMYDMMQITSDVMAVLQSNGLLASKIKTFQELHIDFLSTENNVFQFGLPETLEKLHGCLPDPDYPTILGQKLATLCITLNEHPCIRFQASSPYCREIATVLHQQLLQYKRSNPDFLAHGDDEKSDRERGNMLILDRTFDTVSPLMHEYTYQAMVMDLLTVRTAHSISLSLFLFRSLCLFFTLSLSYFVNIFYLSLPLTLCPLLLQMLLISI